MPAVKADRTSASALTKRLARSGAVAGRRRRQAPPQVAQLRHEPEASAAEQWPGSSATRCAASGSTVSLRIASRIGGVRKLRLCLGCPHDDGHCSLLAPARAESSSSSRVLPRPASPSITSSRPSGAALCHAETRLAQLLAPAHERERRPPASTGSPLPAGARAAGRGKLAGADLLVELRRLGERGHAELAVQGPHAGAVLLDRGATLARPGVQPASAVDGPTRPADRARAAGAHARSHASRSAGLGLAPWPPLEPGPELAPQRLSLRGLPVIELGAVP